ncbi:MULTISPECIES: carboxypeptidase regulatory-like domain-containing protein [unclassified Knoellia]|uniref:carboxypeptidase regulatory-like domain-containing protein n=1 Tax=Knoellia altitudinis TaxID=3404795 RepID=UPI003605FDA0
MSSTVLADSPVRRMRRLVVLVLATVLGATLALAAATPAQAATGQAQTQAASDYAITGVVTGLDAAGRAVPLADAYLYAEPVDWADPRNHYGTTDAAGRFTIDVTEPGEYTLYANCHSGTACSNTYASQYYDQANGHGAAQTIVVSTTTPVTANIRLLRWATVTGKVTGPAGAPIAGITVESSPINGGSVVSTLTDATGAYTLAKVIPGQAQITAREDWDKHYWAPEYWNGTTTSTPAYPDPAPILPEGPTVTTANFQLAPQTGFTAEAVDTAGAPIQGLSWTVYTHNTETGQWDTPQYGPRQTDTKGQFFWRTAVGGRYKICFSDDYYGPEAPARDLRYGSRCWDNAADSTTATIFTQPATPEQRTMRVVLPVVGKSLTASDPWVNGAARVGSPLTVHPGAWGPTGVQLAYQWGIREAATDYVFTPIAGATGASFTPTTAHQGKSVSVRVTGTLAGYAPATMWSIGYAVGSGVVLTSPLRIDGTVATGQVLTANHGTPSSGAAIDYDSYEWRVDGGTVGWDKTLTVTAAMAGKAISVRYYLRTDAGNDDTTYVATVGGSQGTLTAPTPTITGTAKAGSTFTANPGTWGPAPVTLTYQWKRAGVAIAGATASTLALTGADTGKTLTVTVTGTKSGYTTTAKTSAATAVVAAGTLTAPTPTISGSTTVGSTLTAVPGTWGPAPVTLAHQWYRAGVAISGATASTYKLTSTDLGKTLTVRVVGSKTGYTAVAKTSMATSTVLAALTAPTPTITGTAKAGSRLTANPGTWGPAPVTLAYQWRRAGVAITGATASSYVLTGTDTGKTITVTVTGTKSGHTSVARTSAATAVIAAGTLTAPTPTITGTRTVGYTLTATPGTWGPAPVTLAYQWYRAGVAISGATASTYKLTTTDQGKTLTVRVTGSKTGYTAVAKMSAATTAVLGALTSAVPTITGTTRVSYTLTATPGTWGPAPVTFAYQWYRAGVAISGATASTYKLTTTDRGKTLTVRVTGSKAGYMTAGRISVATATIL